MALVVNHFTAVGSAVAAVSGSIRMLCAITLVSTVRGAAAQAHAITKDGFSSDDFDALSRNMFSAFDLNGDGVIDRQEVEHVLPSMTSPEDMKDSTADSRVEGYMLMLDENGDGVGSRSEMASFIRKMNDMDGQLNRLPLPPKQRRTKRRARKRKRSSGTTSHKVEL